MRKDKREYYAPFEANPNACLPGPRTDGINRVPLRIRNVEGALLDCIGEGMGVLARKLCKLGTEGLNSLGVLPSRARNDNGKQCSMRFHWQVHRPVFWVSVLGKS